MISSDEIVETFSLAAPKPAFIGQRFVHDVDGLANPKGFITVTPHVASMKNANIYAAAVAVAIAPPGPTPVLVAVPKTGHMTELMAKAAA